MSRTYFYYPRARVGVHRGPSCSLVRMSGKQGQRLVILNPETYSAVAEYIKRLLSRRYSGWNGSEIEWHC